MDLFKMCTSTGFFGWESELPADGKTGMIDILISGNLENNDRAKTMINAIVLEVSFYTFFYYITNIAYVVYFQLSNKLFDLFNQRNSSISFFDRVILVKANKQKATKSLKMFEFMKIDF